MPPPNAPHYGTARGPARAQIDAAVIEHRRWRVCGVDGRGDEHLAGLCQLGGALLGPLMGGALLDATRSYRIPFYCTAAAILVAPGFIWFYVRERFVPAAQARGGRALLSSLIAVGSSPALLALFFVLLMAQFGVRTVQPVVTLYVKELFGDRPDLATSSGIAFSTTELAKVSATPFSRLRHSLRLRDAPFGRSSGRRSAFDDIKEICHLEEPAIAAVSKDAMRRSSSSEKDNAAWVFAPARNCCSRCATTDKCSSTASASGT
jgi:hypothetical protein